MNNKTESTVYTLLQLYVDKLLHSSIFQFLFSHYGEIHEFTTDAYKVTIVMTGGNYTEGVYIEITSKGYSIYKTLSNHEKDTTRQLFGFYKGVVTMTTASEKANSLLEYKELGVHVVEKLFYFIFSRYNQEYLEQFVDSEQIVKKTGVRENSFLLLKKNRKMLYAYLKELTYSLGENYSNTTYRIIENSYGYISIDNFNQNKESELVIINENNEMLRIIGSNNRLKGFSLSITNPIYDDFLYSLYTVLSEFQPRETYIDIHKRIIHDRLTKELDVYKNLTKKEKERRK